MNTHIPNSIAICPKNMMQKATKMSTCYSEEKQCDFGVILGKSVVLHTSMKEALI